MNILNGNLSTLAIGTIMALIDAFIQTIIKKISLGIIPLSWMFIPSFVIAIQPWIYLNGLNSSSMTILNLTWDLVSSILVTFMGLFYFREEISGIKMIGVLFALLSITLFALDKEK